METLISSSLALVMGAMAAIALPPQMAVPAVMRKEALPPMWRSLPRSKPRIMAVVMLMAV